LPLLHLSVVLETVSHYVCIEIFLKEFAMSTNNDNAAAAVIAFVSGAVIGVAAALLLAPASGRETREKLADLRETASERVKRLAREAKFRVTPKTKGADYEYDGGDAWI
jgi:hypothetical protein